MKIKGVLKQVVLAGVMSSMYLLSSTAEAVLFTWTFNGPNGNLTTVGGTYTETSTNGQADIDVRAFVGNDLSNLGDARVRRVSNALGVNSNPGDANAGQINPLEALLFEFETGLWDLALIDFSAFGAGDEYSVYAGSISAVDIGNGDFTGLSLITAGSTVDPFSTTVPGVQQVLVTGDAGRFRITTVQGTAPEPATLAIVGLGLLGAGLATRRRKKFS